MGENTRSEIDGPVRISGGRCLCLLSLGLGNLALDLKSDAVCTWDPETGSIASYLFQCESMCDILFEAATWANGDTEAGDPDILNI